MWNSVYVVLIPLKDNGEARKICEHNENKVFKSNVEARNFYPKDSIIQNISDFMDDFNNQEIEESKYFMTYCNIN